VGTQATARAIAPTDSTTTPTPGAIGVVGELVRQVRQHFDESLNTQRAARDICAEAIVEAASVLAVAFDTGGKLLLCGNGGSAADCQHMAAEFVSRLSPARERPALPAIALTTDTSFITAHANDYGFDSIFARQIEAMARPRDVLLAISTSGASRNINEAVHAGRTAGMYIIGLFGSGAPLAGYVDTRILVPGPTTQAVQECFLAIEHIVCELVEAILYAGVSPGRRVTSTTP
jgi:D-sedoheptulose 7-phosphate isomerase